MAKFTFKCEKCNKTQQLYVGSSILSIICECGETMKKQMPKLSNTTSTEIADKHSGKKWLEDQQEILKARKEKFFWEVEVPRFVESGIYSIETMLQNGWISVSEEGVMTVNTKPPSQR